MLKNIQSDLELVLTKEGYKKLATKYLGDENVVEITKQLFKNENRDFDEEVCKINDLFY